MAKVFVTNCITSSKNIKVQITDVDTAIPVLGLKERVSAEINCPTNQIEIIYAGQWMENSNTLQSYGLKDGSNIYALKSPSNKNRSAESIAEKPEFLQSPKAVQTAVSQSIHYLRIAIRSSSFRSKISNLKRDKILDNIIAATPGLAQDHVALNFIQDPELLMELIHKTAMTSTLKAHPCLMEAIGHLTAALHDHSEPLRPSGFSYSLNGISDDEDETEENSVSNFVSATRNDPGSAITSAQLASALAAVSAAGNGDSAQLSTGESSGHTSGIGTGSQPLITSGMVSEAMQQALSGVSSAQNKTEGREAQLQQLRAMGITDDNVSLQALQLTGGNVQAALELIFGDFLHDETSES